MFNVIGETAKFNGKLTDLSASDDLDSPKLEKKTESKSNKLSKKESHRKANGDNEQIESLRKVNDDLSKKNKELLEQLKILQEVKAEKEKIEKELGMFKLAAKEGENISKVALNTSIEKNTKLTEELKGLKSQLEAKEKELIENKKQAQGLEAKNQELSEKNKELTNQIEHVKEELNKIRERDFQTRKSLGEFEGQLQAQQEEIVKYQGKIEELEAKLKEQNESKDGAEPEVPVILKDQPEVKAKSWGEKFQQHQKLIFGLVGSALVLLGLFLASRTAVGMKFMSSTADAVYGLKEGVSAKINGGEKIQVPQVEPNQGIGKA